jgi:hypothetical protein
MAKKIKLQSTKAITLVPPQHTSKKYPIVVDSEDGDD